MIIHLDIYTYVYVDMSIVQKNIFKEKIQKQVARIFLRINLY